MTIQECMWGPVRRMTKEEIDVINKATTYVSRHMSRLSKETRDRFIYDPRPCTVADLYPRPMGVPRDG